MSDALSHIDEIETAKARPSSGGLWACACSWAQQMICIFGKPEDIAVGLSRRLALRCRNWLWSIEGIVRRLIIASAFAIDASTLPPLRRRIAPARPRQKAGGARRPGFRLFAVTGPARLGRGGKGAAPKAERLYAHVPFPADDLLRVGAPRTPRIFPQTTGTQRPSGEGQAPRRVNPLHRRGRITRWDPDYHGHRDQDLLNGPRPSPPPRTRPRRQRPKLARISSLHRPPVSTEWRRVEEEWDRVLPAPDIAARLTALLRVMNQPASCVHRLARRLQMSNLAARLAALPPPALRRPRLDRSQPPPAQDTLAQSHTLLRRDTS